MVDPSEVSVLDPAADPARPGHDLATLTLTTCNPKYSAAQRLIVQAQLDLPPGAAAAPAGAHAERRNAATTIGGLSGESSSRTPAILWGVIAAVVGLLWWLLFHRYPRWTTWFVGVVPFLVVLFVCYTYVERLLPVELLSQLRARRSGLVDQRDDVAGGDGVARPRRRARARHPGRR